MGSMRKSHEPRCINNNAHASRRGGDHGRRDDDHHSDDRRRDGRRGKHRAGHGGAGGSLKGSRPSFQRGQLSSALSGETKLSAQLSPLSLKHFRIGLRGTRLVRSAPETLQD